MVEFYQTNRRSIDRGNFPLNHDCILKVTFSPGCGVRFGYYTCRSQDSGLLVDIISKVHNVKYVKISSVDDLPDNF